MAHKLDCTEACAKGRQEGSPPVLPNVSGCSPRLWLCLTLCRSPSISGSLVDLKLPF